MMNAKTWQATENRSRMMPSAWCYQHQTTKPTIS